MPESSSTESTANAAPIENAGAAPHSIPTRKPARIGNTIPLASLAPEFQAAQHQIYLDLLRRALRHRDTRSIALTGSYGSGKSSVLRALRRRWWNRRVIVELSLSTLDPQLAPEVPAENPAESEMSNRIQKELVKQLLYRLPSRSTPRSRFPRASNPSWVTGIRIALTAAAVVGLVWVATLLVGWDASISLRLVSLGWTPALVWSVAAFGAAIVALIGWKTFGGRYAIKAGLSAGTLTVSLEPTSSSYFDQYLDEIMYFFQVSKTRIVLIEDVDRYGDAVVFDTLRALNTLINSSRQVGRRVVFVYAIRDSVLGKIGGESKTDDSSNVSLAGRDAGSFDIDRANRAKYFEVIIPIVPFVTTDNARDLMMQVMSAHVSNAEGSPGISPALIRLAARHVADMRTLWSILNEFEVHLDRLMTSAVSKKPGINEDIVFSLVLLRATSPNAYESIRLATSPLDSLTDRWIALVDTNLEAQTKELTSLRTQLENSESLDSRAKQAGQLLDSLRPQLLTMSTGSATVVEFASPIADANLADVAGWQQLANGAPLTINLWDDPSRRRLSQSVRMGPEMVALLIGMRINPQAWQDTDLEKIREKVRATEKEIAFLRHHTWEQLYSRTDIVIAAKANEIQEDEVQDKGGEDSQKIPNLSFKDLVRAYAPTILAQDLLAQGYLPRHFARYASMFYGAVVGLDADEYISRAIEPGVPIFEFELTDLAITQVLAEQNAKKDNAEFFDDPSTYNLDIVAYLLKNRPAAARSVAHHLAVRWTDLEQAFVGRFLQRETPTLSGSLAAFMALSWKQGLRYTAIDAELAPDARLHIVNAVLGATEAEDTDDLDLDTDVGQYLSEHYPELPSVVNPLDDARANTVMQIMAASGAIIHDLTKLSSVALAAAIELSIYPINANNLGALGGADRVALDTLRSGTKTKPTYDYLLGNLSAYLDALSQLKPVGGPVKAAAEFAAVLNDIAAVGSTALLDRLVEATSLEFRIADLSSTAPETWPALIGHGRADSSFDNVQRYIAEHGFDNALGKLLNEQGKIATPAATPQTERVAVALEILAARDTLPKVATRVALVNSLAPGVMSVRQLAPDDANLVGPLLAAGLLEDEPATFDPVLLNLSEDLESAIAASDSFGTFSDDTTMPPRHLSRILTNARIPRKTKTALVVKLAILLTLATSTDATAIAQALAGRREKLDQARIEALRAAGASNPSLVRLMVAQGNELPVSDVRTILLAMRGDYGRVSSGGNGTVHFDPDEDHRFLLSRLEGVTHTGAKERRTKRYGNKIEANLKQP
jgi:hypothetical protein